MAPLNAPGGAVAAVAAAMALTCPNDNHVETDTSRPDMQAGMSASVGVRPDTQDAGVRSTSGFELLQIWLSERFDVRLDMPVRPVS
jgi:hypothetical protein